MIWIWGKCSSSEHLWICSKKKQGSKQTKEVSGRTWSRCVVSFQEKGNQDHTVVACSLWQMFSIYCRKYLKLFTRAYLWARRRKNIFCVNTGKTFWKKKETKDAFFFLLKMFWTFKAPKINSRFNALNLEELEWKSDKKAPKRLHGNKLLNVQRAFLFTEQKAVCRWPG